MPPPDLPPRPVPGRSRAVDAVLHLLLALVGAAAVGVALVAVPAGVVAVRVAVASTAVAVLTTLVLAVATAATRQHPVLRASSLEGAPALVVRAWAGEWWYDLVLDAGLAVLAGTLVGLALAADPPWVVAAVVVGVVGAWFLRRVLLALTGRRRVEALWLTAEEVVHDAGRRRERVRREQVTRVRPSTVGAALVLEVEGPVSRTPATRPSRARTRARADRVVVDTSRMGHVSADLAAWLARELALAPGGRR